MNITQEIIFWDWNGTLLNDTQSCVDAMNTLLHRRGRAKIDIDYYKSVFGFPVKDYYTQLGFDFSKESFEDLSVEFISNYNKNLDKAELQPFSVEVLEFFRNAGKTQVVISAMEHNMLQKQLSEFGVINYFDDVNGIDDIYASSKTYLAENYISKNNLSPDTILFIGDTLHDMEVAEEIGAEILLVSNGHHQHSRLQINGNHVINDLKSLL